MTDEEKLYQEYLETDMSVEEYQRRKGELARKRRQPFVHALAEGEDWAVNRALKIAGAVIVLIVLGSIALEVIGLLVNGGVGGLEYDD